MSDNACAHDWVKMHVQKTLVILLLHQHVSTCIFQVNAATTTYAERQHFSDVTDKLISYINETLFLLLKYR